MDQRTLGSNKGTPQDAANGLRLLDYGVGS
jgi:hypothetical protein